jgi:hypothetical protein
LGYGEKGVVLYRSFLKVGDLVCEKDDRDKVGVVVDKYDKNLGTDYQERVVVVEWVATGTRKREEHLSTSLTLLKMEEKDE